MASENRSIARYETTAAYSDPAARVDIILVHGLNGAPDKTWTAANGVFWPLDLLPASLRGARANVLLYGFNGDAYARGGGSASDNTIEQHAQTLVASVALFRRGAGTGRNGIVWVCHSLGGVLVKRALLYSHDVRAPQHDHLRSLYVSTVGLVFLGTPHAGAALAGRAAALRAVAAAVVPRRVFESEAVLLRALRRDSETLASINGHFLDIYHRFRIHMAHENRKTDIGGTKVVVVDAGSASPQLPGVTYYGVEATHAQMCKFASASAPGYRALATDVRQWVLDAPPLVAVRWEAEDQERAARLRSEMRERMPPFATPSSPDALVGSAPSSLPPACPSVSSPPPPPPPIPGPTLMTARHDALFLLDGTGRGLEPAYRPGSG